MPVMANFDRIFGKPASMSDRLCGPLLAHMPAGTRESKFTLSSHLQASTSPTCQCHYLLSQMRLRRKLGGHEERAYHEKVEFRYSL